MNNINQCPGGCPQPPKGLQKQMIETQPITTVKNKKAADLATSGVKRVALGTSASPTKLFEVYHRFGVLSMSSNSKLAGMRSTSLFVPHPLKMPLAGLEPATATSLVRRSIQLSYRGSLGVRVACIDYMSNIICDMTNIDKEGFAEGGAEMSDKKRRN